MPLVAKQLSNELKVFITQVNKMKQTDKDKAIDAYCNKLESAIYTAIKSLTITIPPGMIIVAGSPTTQTNPAPIVLTGIIK